MQGYYYGGGQGQRRPGGGYLGAGMEGFSSGNRRSRASTWQPTGPGASDARATDNGYSTGRGPGYNSCKPSSSSSFSSYPFQPAVSAHLARPLLSSPCEEEHSQLSACGAIEVERVLQANRYPGRSDPTEREGMSERERGGGGLTSDSRFGGEMRIAEPPHERSSSHYRYDPVSGDGERRGKRVTGSGAGGGGVEEAYVPYVGGVWAEKPNNDHGRGMAGSGGGGSDRQAHVPYVGGVWLVKPDNDGPGYGYGGPTGSRGKRENRLGGKMKGSGRGGGSVGAWRPDLTVPVDPRSTVTTVISWDSGSTSEMLDVTVTNDVASVDCWINSLSQTAGHRVTLGIDVEWRPNLQSGEDNPVAILQLAWENTCLIVQLIHMVGESMALKQLLLSPQSTFVGVGVSKDLSKLEEDHGLACQGVKVELGALAAQHYGDRTLRNAGLKGLVEKVLNFSLVKQRNVTMSAWDSPVLCERQIRYAAFDAWMSFLIWKRLTSSPPAVC